MAHPVVHFEVSGNDLDKLQSFYSELFGWKTNKVPGDMPYAMVEKEGDGIGGGIGQAPNGNGHVTFYVDTDDPQATLDKAEQLGDKSKDMYRARFDLAGDGAATGHDRALRGPRRARDRTR